MEIPQAELFSVLREFNPWWSGQPIDDLPDWERTASKAVWRWVGDRDERRALLLTGARQTGKTTLYRQAIRRLVAEGYPPENILYVTFDHPVLKLARLEDTLNAWNALTPPRSDVRRLLFLDEIQHVADWQVWLKHRVDFHREDRVAVTGSAIPLRSGSTESGVGRWETIPLPTFSFGEFLKLRKVDPPPSPTVNSLLPLFDWSEAQFSHAQQAARSLTPHFHEYLLRGGFPEPALAVDLGRCQRLLREDVVGKVLNRDLTAFFGVRKVLEVEKIFLYLCRHDGGILDLGTLTRELDGINKQSAINFLDVFEASHLIYRLKPFGYGKEILRGRDKVYLVDAALPGAVFLRGRQLLIEPERLGAAVETAFFKHVFTRFYQETPTFSYWRDRKHADQEVDIVAEIGDRLVPFEVKYQGTRAVQGKLKGLRLFMEERDVDRGYVVTQLPEDIGLLPATSARPGHGDEPLKGKILRIPASLACLWLS